MQTQRFVRSCTCFHKEQVPVNSFVPHVHRQPIITSSKAQSYRQAQQQHKLQRVVVRAAEVQAETAEPAQQQSQQQSQHQGEKEFDVYLDKPLGLRFARGNDGSAYISKSDAKLGSTDERIEVGDKIIKISASFGTDVWDAKNFGQVMYAIKTRNGQVYLRIEKKFGDLSALQEEELTEAEKQWRAERSGGNYGAGTKEMQQKNYIERREAERRRRQLFDDALEKFKKNDTENALVDFENVLALEPKNYVGDDFSRVTQIYRVTQYNIACCYAALDQVEPGLDALKGALAAGFEQFGKVRTDPNLDNLRKSPKFKPLIDQYDEPVFNEGAIKAIKNIFSFGKKD